MKKKKTQQSPIFFSPSPLFLMRAPVHALLRVYRVDVIIVPSRRVVASSCHSVCQAATPEIIDEKGRIC
jgi:hypothetical protein